MTAYILKCTYPDRGRYFLLNKQGYVLDNDREHFWDYEVYSTLRAAKMVATRKNNQNEQNRLIEQRHNERRVKQGKNPLNTLYEVEIYEPYAVEIKEAAK